MESVRLEGNFLIVAGGLSLLVAGLATLAAGFLSGFGGEDSIRVASGMTFPAETWDRASPESQGVDSRKLKKAVSWFRKRAPGDGVDELAIVRNGKLIWAGPEIDKVHGVWSITKVFSGTVLGCLVEEGKCDLDTRVATVLPETEAAFPDVTLEHLVTMSSGYEAEGDWPPANPSYLNGSSSTPFTPAATPQFAPGAGFSYWDSAVNLLGLALTEIAGESLESVFERRIAGPVGMNPEAWNWRKFSETEGGIVVNGGSGNKGKHIEISASDLARFGHLMLNRGRWGERQVIGADWVAAATAVQVPADRPLGGPIADQYGDRFPYDGRGVFGFAWWVNGVGPDGSRRWPNVPAGIFAATGYHNNRLFVIPEWNLVVVRLGLDEKERRIERSEFAGFLSRIGKAIED